MFVLSRCFLEIYIFR